MMLLNCFVFCRCEEEEGALFVFSASRVPASTADSLPPTVELTAKAVADAGTPTKAGTAASTMDSHGRKEALEAEQPVPELSYASCSNSGGEEEPETAPQMHRIQITDC